MINQYPGKCALCGETVLAGKGKLMNQRNWLFRVAHKTGQCPKKEDQDASNSSNA